MNVTVLAGLVGATDTAAFFAKRLHLLRTKPARAGGIVASLALWTALTARAAADGRRASGATVALAGAALSGSGAMLALHLRHRVMQPRVFIGAGAAGLALADALRRR